MPGDADDFGIPQQNSTFSENPREGILKKYATQNGPCLVQAFLVFDDVNFWKILFFYWRKLAYEHLEQSKKFKKTFLNLVSFDVAFILIGFEWYFDYKLWFVSSSGHQSRNHPLASRR